MGSSLKKPINRIAIGLWLLAALVLGSEVWVFANAYRWGPTGTVNFLGNFWQLIRSGVLSAGDLVAFGAMVELLDRIRWTILKPEERANELSRPSIWHLVRRWHGSTAD